MTPQILNLIPNEFFWDSNGSLRSVLIVKMQRRFESMDRQGVKWAEFQINLQWTSNWRHNFIAIEALNIKELANFSSLEDARDLQPFRASVTVFSFDFNTWKMAWNVSREEKLDIFWHFKLLLVLFQFFKKFPQKQLTKKECEFQVWQIAVWI